MLQFDRFRFFRGFAHTRGAGSPSGSLGVHFLQVHDVARIISEPLLNGIAYATRMGINHMMVRPVPNDPLRLLGLRLLSA
jgi:hypothetical protein